MCSPVNVQNSCHLRVVETLSLVLLFFLVISIVLLQRVFTAGSQVEVAACEATSSCLGHLAKSAL